MRAAPAVSRAKCTKESAHEHTGQRRQSGIPCAMVLRLMPCSPRRRIRLVTVACGSGLVQARSGRRVSTDLTSATDARSTRFCRTLQHRSSACRRSLTGLSPTRPAIACHAQRCRVHRIPSRVRDDRDTPLLPGETGEFVGVICPTVKRNFARRVNLSQARRAGERATRPSRANAPQLRLRPKPALA